MGAMRNRLGKDGGQAIAFGLRSNNCLVQYLHLRSVTLGNDDAELIADSLADYHYLLHLDLCHNRLEGIRGGAACCRILGRDMKSRGGVNLQHFNLAHNKLGDSGFSLIINALLEPTIDVEVLNLSYN